MAKLNYSFLCESSIISKEGTPSFISVFSGINAKKLPIKKAIHVVTNFTLEPKEKGNKNVIGVVVGLANSTDKPIDSMESPTSAATDNIGFVSKMEELEFEKAGTYNFEITFNGEKAGSIPLNIQLL